MTAIHVDRYMFTVDEVVGTLLPNIGRARELELRVDADGYVVIDVVAPVAAAAAAKTEDAKQASGDDTFPGDRPSQAEPAPASNERGPKEEEARSLCAMPLFRAFLEVKTEEAALKILTERCHVQKLGDLDRTRSNAMNLRHVVEEFEAWKIT